MNRPVLILSLLVTVIASSCTTMPPFTTEKRDRYGLSGDDVEQVQFYVSERIVLQRRLTGAEAGSMAEVTPGHTLRRIEGEYVEEIVIEQETPCVVVDAESTGAILHVAFEQGAYLIFDPARVGGNIVFGATAKAHSYPQVAVLCSLCHRCP